MTKKYEFDKEIKKYLRRLIKEKPEVIINIREVDGVSYYTNVINFREVMIELLEWQESELNKFDDNFHDENKFKVNFVPEEIKDVINQMLSLVEDKDDINKIFGIVKRFYEREDDKSWKRKFAPVSKDDKLSEFHPDDWKITQEDLERAFTRWDESMPEYRGMLNPKIGKKEKIKNEHYSNFCWNICNNRRC